ncbi:ATP-dependent helicase HrpB [Marinobacterium marinum]|uniref:ATP-dependent helicase HrpB n=1 Tax=Marinobacterium marinum TaxID=2756129 RepID=A0A7W1WWD4_9GAMM|nr:ATP-dependent helicase HrpB [Marinobacterium marinum]MBA4501436.1 ATP-dependent helicase HrpB [Marinobacterium marinum]
MTQPQSLPIDALLDPIRQTLSQHDELILEAPPGAGKTTRVPLALLNQPWLGDQKIIMLEPRRLAAKAAAQRLSEQLGESLGQTVGYRIRLESKVSAATRIEVITEGILSRMLQDDPGLAGVGLIIFDEFHERSLDGDTALALALQGRELLREGPPLKLLLMSATLDGESLSVILGNAPVVRSEGRAHPVELIYSRPNRTDSPIEERVARCIAHALEQHKGSLLVFLPGQGEIRRVMTLLDSTLPTDPDRQITPLYGDLSLQEQQQAIDVPEPGLRKVVLATAIAETSLTIEGVEAVIDSGLSRQARFDPGSGMTRLLTTRVSAATAIQRAGRAGRLGPGTCYRLWSEQQQELLEPQPPAEILHADLAPLALQLLRWGVNSPDELCWITPPPQAPYHQALDLLHQLGAVESLAAGRFRLTTHGERMAELPTHPRLAHLLLCGARYGQIDLAADIAALLSERDPLKTSQADLQLRLEWLNAAGHSGTNQRLRRMAHQFRALCPRSKTDVTPGLAQQDVPGFLIACAYPDRIARQREQHSNQYRLSQGRGAQLGTQDRLGRHDWLAIAALSSRQDSATDTIRLAVALNPALFDTCLADLQQREQVIEWDTRQDRLIAGQHTRVGRLTVRYEPNPHPDPDQRTAALVNRVRQQGLSLLHRDEACERLRQRVSFVRCHDPEPKRWPDWSDTALLETLEEWLPPWLEGISKGSDFARLSLATILRSRLDWSLQQELDTLAPERMQVPSGSSIRIDYSKPHPVLAVKLQEMFGCTDTPTLGFKVPVLLHLLSPAQRPLQVTRDLAGFWQGSYADVRKEMKGRYPKHPWPEDPAQALPTARTKRATHS